jgi:virginiamycin B lyase
MNKSWLFLTCVVAVAGCSSPSQVVQFPAQGSMANAPTIAQFHNDGAVEPELSSSNIIEKFTLSPNPQPNALALGSDGNIWFSESGSNNIGRITPSGSFTQFPVPDHPFRVAPGPSGTLLISDFHSIVEMTMSGGVTSFPLPSGDGATGGITVGPDNNIWFTDGNTQSIGKMTPSGTVTEFQISTSNVSPGAIVVGSDGNLWFTEQIGKVGRITTSGTITEFPIVTSNAQPFDIVSATDGALYVSTFLLKLEKVTTSGVVSEFPLPVADAVYLIQGPDKKLWISYEGHAQIGQFDIDKDVALTPANEPVASSGAGLATGADGNVWFANFGGYIGVIAPTVTTIGMRFNGEISFTDPHYGFELGYAKGSSTTTQTISLPAGTYVHFKNFDTTSHTASFLGDATKNNAPWPATFAGGMTASPKLTAIGTTGFSSGSILPGKTSRVYEVGSPGFYMIGCGFDYDLHEMRTVIIVH